MTLDFYPIRRGNNYYWEAETLLGFYSVAGARGSSGFVAHFEQRTKRDTFNSYWHYIGYFDTPEFAMCACQLDYDVRYDDRHRQRVRAQS